MTPPKDKKLEISRLAQIYNNMVATYKFYWFVAILDIVVKERRQQISFWEIIVGMITEAWYPIHYFRLSFGKSDSLYDQIIALQKELNISIDANKNDINNCPYSINGGTIEINPQWEQYLTEHYAILRDFTFWNLAIFLQKRNPNVSDIPSKLVKPIQRDSLTKQKH